MKVLVLICLVVMSYSQDVNNEEILKKWQSYQVEFGKSYRSPVEAQKRLLIFKDNLEKIEEHNALYAKGEVTHTEGINQFTDWTEDEFMQYVNKGLINKPVVVNEVVDTFYNMSDVIESSFDWRTAGVVTPVKNQGQCGSCWSFSVTGAIEGQLGRKGRLVSLSEQNLIDCSTSYGNMGCNGGYMNLALDYVRQYGLESERDYPYQAYNGYCRANPSKIVTKIAGYYSIPKGSEAVLLNAIRNVGPISVGIVSTSNLQRYSSGIFRDDTCAGKALNHGVLAVGYGNANGLNYYIVKNSWGAQWGEAGYFRLEMRNNQCGIASWANYPYL